MAAPGQVAGLPTPGDLQSTGDTEQPDTDDQQYVKVICLGVKQDGTVCVYDEDDPDNSKQDFSSPDEALQAAGQMLGGGDQGQPDERQRIWDEMAAKRDAARSIG